MGLLDDAIREHLELKRRRGADAEEVSRLEQEALGPPQRGEFADAAAPAEGAEPVDAPAPAVDEADPDRVAAVQAEPAPEVVEEAPPPPEEPEPRDDVEEGWLEDEPQPGPAAVAAPEHLGQPTVEHPAPAGSTPDGEDVLEETPEFLQETPEHDRLWFEQKPPRDFDLDR